MKSVLKTSIILSTLMLTSCGTKSGNTETTTPEKEFKGSVASELAKVDLSETSNFKASVEMDGKFIGHVSSDGHNKIKIVTPEYNQEIRNVLPAGLDTHGYLLFDRNANTEYYYGASVRGNRGWTEGVYRYSDLSLKKSTYTGSGVGASFQEFYWGGPELGLFTDENISKSSANVYTASTQDEYGFTYNYVITMKNDSLYSVENAIVREEPVLTLKFIYESIGEETEYTLDDYNNFQEQTIIVKTNTETGEVSLA